MEVYAIISALTTAASWAFVTQLQKRGLQSTDARTGAFIVILSFASLFWILAPFFLIDRHWFGSWPVVIFALSGVLVPGLAQQFHMLSVERMGPTATAVIGSFTPAFAIVPSMIVLRETLNHQGIVGIILMVCGVILTVKANTTNKPQFAYRLIWLAFIAAVCRGLSQPLTKTGLIEMPEPFFATLVMVTSAVIFMGICQVCRDRSTIRFSLGPHTLWLVASGIIVSMGFLALYMALHFGDVVIVSPFIATVPIWVLIFNHFIFKTEQITKLHVTAAWLATCGAIVLILR